MDFSVPTAISVDGLIKTPASLSRQHLLTVLEKLWHGLELPFHTIAQCGHFFPPLFFFFHAFANVASGFDGLDTSGMGLVR